RTDAGAVVALAYDARAVRRSTAPRSCGRRPCPSPPPAPGGPPAMAIDRIDVNVTSPGRNFVTVKVTTSDGIVGWGDGTLNGRELAVASYLRDHVAPTLIGRDESAIEQTWQYLYRSPYWRRGPVTMSAVAAIDMALWDIAAKKAGEPLYKL